MKADRTVKRITIDRNTAYPGETLCVSVFKLKKHEEIVPRSLSLLFDIDLTGGHANNYLVQNVSRALVDKLVVKFAATTLHPPLDTIFTKHLRICSSPRTNAITCFWMAFRVRNCVRFALTLATRRHQLWMRKIN